MPAPRWVCHAEGTLSPGSVEPSADLSVWPPAGAVAVDLADGYERLAARGYGYGPAFRGLTATWVRGEEVFAEVRLPDAAGGVSGFGVHPALLDAAMHAVVMTDQPPRRRRLVLPFSWQGVSLHAAGASAVRARIAPASASCLQAVSIELADGLGLPVLSVRAMVARPVSEQQLRAGGVGRRVRTGCSRWCGRRLPADSVVRRRRRLTNCLNPLRPKKIRWRRLISARIRRWPPCSHG